MRQRALPVHPRVCGEQDTLPVAISSHAGSSPRVRGTGRGAQPGDFAGNLIKYARIVNDCGQLPGSAMPRHLCGIPASVFVPWFILFVAGYAIRITRTIPKRSAGFQSPIRWYPFALGNPVDIARYIVYAGGPKVDSPDAYDKTGVSCRNCNRKSCLQRTGRQ